MQIRASRKILEANDLVAGELRSEFETAGVFVVNIMGSPGAGKTSLLERTLEHNTGVIRFGVIEGDIATSLDADRIVRFGAPVVQINTGGACHLDALMIGDALSRLDLTELDLLLIENVGNLVCPAQFDLGEAAKVVVSSVPEGDDKVAKYPSMFNLADAVVLNKIDLLEHTAFDLSRFRRQAAEVNPTAPLIEVSCVTGQGIELWVKWLCERLSATKS